MRLLVLLCCVLLTACTLALPGAGDKHARPAANPITAGAMGGAISTTALDASIPAETSAASAVAKPGSAPVAASRPEASPKPVAAQTVAQPQMAKPIASPQELACIKKGGAWRSTGKSGGEACFTLTKDAGKSCKKESDCDGYCLARSGSCAPFKPMFGCNDILQDNGVMVTLCID